jgi:hypothetical protein
VILGVQPTPVVTTADHHSGNYSALLGTLSGPEPTGDGSIYQQITVPPAGGTLSYWWNGGTTDTITFDWQDAYVTDTSGTILATIQHTCQTTGGWVHQTFDMSPWAGQTVRVEFLVHQDGVGDDTHMYVDDVSLDLPCGSVTATSTRTSTPPAPTATPTCILTWREVDSPNASGANWNDLVDVTGVPGESLQEAWAVGYAANLASPNPTFTPLLEQWITNQWYIPLQPVTTDSHMGGITAISGSDVWAVGDYDTSLGHQPLLLHWSGESWDIVPAPSIVVPWGGVRDVAAVASNDVWVVGSLMQSGSTQPLSLHWNGSVWTQVPVPAQGSHSSLQGLAVVSSTDIWAVGEMDSGTPIFMHWDGASWSLFNNPGSVSGILLRVSAVSGSDIWAVGYLTDSSGLPLTMHWDGTSWTVVSNPIPCCNQQLNDVQAIATNDVWAVSENYIIHWDGSAWNIVNTSSPPPNTTYYFEGIGKGNQGDAWAVGHTYIYLGGGDNFNGTLTEHYSNDCQLPGFTPTTTHTPNPLFTSTPTSTPTQATTGTPGTPSPGPTDYAFIPSTATVVSGTTDIGNHCDDCTTVINLPFPATLYDRQFNTVILGSNGTLGFVADANLSLNGCIPEETSDFGIFPYWDNLDTETGSCPLCGIFTSVSGTAPNRLFNIEWRATRVGGDGSMLNFEVRLYEGSGRFDIIYGQVDPQATESIGVQRDTGSLSTRVLCLLGDSPGQARQSLPNGWIISEGVKLGFGAPPPASPTSTAPSTSTRTAGTPTTGTPTTRTPTTTAATPTVCTLQFTDVPPGSTFYPFVHCMVCIGIINGYPDGTFRPNNQVTRGQLSKIVTNSAGFNDPQPNQMFQDVPVGSTFQVFIGRLASRGYISGYPCGGPDEPCVPPDNLPYFRPNANATRGQISKIDSNAANFNDPPSGQQFEDVAVGSTFYTYTYRLVSRSVMSGYPCGGPGEPCVPPDNLPYFRSNNNATRGQTAKIVANTFFPDCNVPREGQP